MCSLEIEVCKKLFRNLIRGQKATSKKGLWMDDCFLWYEKIVVGERNCEAKNEKAVQKDMPKRLGGGVRSKSYPRQDYMTAS